MEILSDTVFRGGMQAKSVTVGNVNITSDSVVVPSLYANQLLFCNGSQSISNFSDISNYVSGGSSSSNGKFESICACNLSITSCVSIKDKATITNYSGYGYSLVVNGTEYINGDLCVYGRTHLTDNLTVDGCVEINRSAYFNDYIWLNGESINRWSDLSQYISGGSGSAGYHPTYEKFCSYPKTSDGSYFDTRNGKLLIVSSNAYDPYYGSTTPYGTTILNGGCLYSPDIVSGCSLTLSGERIYCWSDLSQYIGGGCGSGSSSSDLSQYLYYCQGYDELVLCSSSVCSLNINYSKIKFTEFEYPTGLGHFTVGANGKHVACFYLPTAGYFNSSYSSSTPNYTSTSYVPKDNELVTAGWVRNNISGGSGSSSSGASVYQSQINQCSFIIPGSCRNFLLHTISGVSPDKVGPIEIRGICTDGDGNYYPTKEPATVFLPCGTSSDFHFTLKGCSSQNSTKIFGSRNDTYYSDVSVDPLILVTTIQK